MSRFDLPRYLLDGEPASADDLINRASRLDASYGRDGFKWTSHAARILRDHGHVVEANPNFKEEEVAP